MFNNFIYKIFIDQYLYNIFVDSIYVFQKILFNFMNMCVLNIGKNKNDPIRMYKYLISFKIIIIIRIKIKIIINGSFKKRKNQQVNIGIRIKTRDSYQNTKRS